MSINKTLYTALITAAKKGEVMHYQNAMKVVGIKIGGYNAGRIGKMLNAICERETAEGRPMLGAVVASKITKIPGQGFFKLAKSLGRQTTESDTSFYHTELTRVFKYWKKS